LGTTNIDQNGAAKTCKIGPLHSIEIHGDLGIPHFLESKNKISKYDQNVVCLLGLSSKKE
jgi:hypothetical protein